MQAHIEELEAHVHELEVRLGQNSQNSSRPHSSDFPRVKSPKKLASTVRRKRGAQPGQAEDEKEWRHQVVELPELKARVTEYRIHSRKCPECGQRVQAQLPPGVPRRHFGPTFQATAAILTGRYRLSRREAQQLLADLWSGKISLGALSGLEEATSNALENVVSDVAQSVNRAGERIIVVPGCGRQWLRE